MLTENVPTLGSNAFKNTKCSDGTLQVPTVSVEAYKSADQWKEWGNIVGITPPNDEQSDALYADTIATIKKEITLPLQLKNEDTIIGYQCDIQLPAGVEFAKNSNGRFICTTSDRCDDHTITTKLQEDGSLRLMCVSMSNTPFEGNDGVIANIAVKISEDLEPGEYSIIIKNGVLSTENNEKISLPETSCVLIIEDYTPGDVNDDGDIDVVDVTTTISAALGDEPENFNFKAADVNEDGEIDVVDVTTIISMAM